MTPKQEALMARIETLFHAEGFAHFSVGELATTLKVSRRSLYELAPTKDELLVSVVRRGYNRRLLNAKDAVFKQSDALQRVFAFMRAVHPNNARHRRHYREDVARVPATNRERLLHIRVMMEMLEGLVRDCIEQKCMRPLEPSIVTLMAFSMLNTVSDPETAERLGMDYHEMFRKSFDLFLNGLLLEPVEVRQVLPDSL